MRMRTPSGVNSSRRTVPLDSDALSHLPHVQARPRNQSATDPSSLCLETRKPMTTTRAPMIGHPITPVAFTRIALPLAEVRSSEKTHADDEAVLGPQLGKAMLACLIEPLRYANVCDSDPLRSAYATASTDGSEGWGERLHHQASVKPFRVHLASDGAPPHGATHHLVMTSFLPALSAALRETLPRPGATLRLGPKAFRVVGDPVQSTFSLDAIEGLSVPIEGVPKRMGTEPGRARFDEVRVTFHSATTFRVRKDAHAREQVSIVFPEPGRVFESVARRIQELGRLWGGWPPSPFFTACAALDLESFRQRISSTLQVTDYACRPVAVHVADEGTKPRGRIERGFVGTATYRCLTHDGEFLRFLRQLCRLMEWVGVGASTTQGFGWAMATWAAATQRGLRPESGTTGRRTLEAVAKFERQATASIIPQLAES